MSSQTIKFVYDFLADSFQNRRLLLRLSVRNFLSGTFGSVFGLIWVIAEPLVYVGVLFVFFTKAARFTPSGDAPYLPWLMCAMSVWQFFSSTTNASLRMFQNYSYFLKKWEFNLAILPVVIVISNLFLHFIFMTLLVLVFFSSGVSFSMYWLQSLYYLFSLCILMSGLSWTLGSIFLFFKDLANIWSILLQLGFWVSPIFWDVEKSPMGIGHFLRWNPMNYIIQGYRDSFLYHIGVPQRSDETIVFWSLTVCIWLLGIFFYRKLRPSFGDVV